MQFSQLHYLPIAPLFFAVLIGIFFLVLLLIQLGILRYAYMRLGVSSTGAFILLARQLFQYSGLAFACGNGFRGPRDRVLRNALRGAYGGAMAWHNHCCERWRNRDSDRHVHLFACQK